MAVDKTETLSMRVTPELKHLLKLAAAREHRTQTNLLERLLVGVDPLRTEAVREICKTVDFHGGRPWAVEVAVWDLVGKALGEEAFEHSAVRQTVAARGDPGHAFIRRDDHDGGFLLRTWDRVPRRTEGRVQGVAVRPCLDGGDAHQSPL